jgi:hypothetical protein
MVVWFLLLLLCQVFLEGHGTVTVLLDRSWLLCRMGGLLITVKVCAFIILPHGPRPDSSSINKVTNCLVKEFYWNKS